MLSIDFLKLDDKFGIIVKLFNKLLLREEHACPSLWKAGTNRGFIGQRLLTLLLTVLTLREDFTVNCGT